MKQQRIKQLRREWRDGGRSQNAVARHLGISNGHFSKVLRGKAKPSSDLALAIETETGVTLRELVGRAS